MKKWGKLVSSVCRPAYRRLASEGTSYLVLGLPAAGRYFVQSNLVSCIKKKDYLFVAFFLFFSFFFLLLFRSLGRRLFRRFLGIHSFSHLSGVLRVQLETCTLI